MPEVRESATTWIEHHEPGAGSWLPSQGAFDETFIICAASPLPPAGTLPAPALGRRVVI